MSAKEVAGFGKQACNLLCAHVHVSVPAAAAFCRLQRGRLPHSPEHMAVLVAPAARLIELVGQRWQSGVGAAGVAAAE